MSSDRLIVGTLIYVLCPEWGGGGGIPMHILQKKILKRDLKNGCSKNPNKSF